MKNDACCCDETCLVHVNDTAFNSVFFGFGKLSGQNDLRTRPVGGLDEPSPSSPFPRRRGVQQPNGWSSIFFVFQCIEEALNKSSPGGCIRFNVKQ